MISGWRRVTLSKNDASGHTWCDRVTLALCAPRMISQPRLLLRAATFLMERRDPSRSHNPRSVLTLSCLRNTSTLDKHEKQNCVSWSQSTAVLVSRVATSRHARCLFHTTVIIRNQILCLISWYNPNQTNKLQTEQNRKLLKPSSPSHTHTHAILKAKICTVECLQAGIHTNQNLQISLPRCACTCSSPNYIILLLKLQCTIICAGYNACSHTSAPSPRHVIHVNSQPG